MQKYFLLFSFLFLTTLSFAQTGTIKGQIIDSTLNEGVIGANVVIEGTQIGGSTDIDGNYIISSLQPGTYNLVITYIGYKTKQISGVVVYAGKITTVNSFLKEDSGQLQDVVITAERETYSEISVISEIRLAEVVAVGISAEQISKSQDRDASQVVRRVPGVNISENNFIRIRGLAERYNNVMLHNAFAPSTETDVRAFAFNIIPSSQIDRLLVYKSPAADLPGDFAGGLVKVFTKSIPSENSLTIDYSTQFRAGTTFQDFRNQERSNTHWTGFNSGFYDLPGNFPVSLKDPAIADNPIALQQAGQSLNSQWAVEDRTAGPDQRFAITSATRFNAGNTKIGNITSVNYSNSYTTFGVERNDFDAFTNGQNSLQNFSDNQYTQNIRLGILHNWAFKFNQNNTIELKNLFNQTGNSQYVDRISVAPGADAEQAFGSYDQVYRGIYTGQLIGKHTLFGENGTLEWVLGYNRAYRDQPDYRRYRVDRDETSQTLFVPSGNGNIFFFGRFFGEMRENTYTGSVNYTHKLNFLNKGNKELTPEIRAGVFVEDKVRNFDARQMGFVRANSSNFDLSLLSLSIDQLLQPVNINPTTGLRIDEQTNPSDSYKGTNRLIAGYLMFKVYLSSNVNLLAGVRIEDNEQGIFSRNLVNEPADNILDATSILPSINLTYNLNDKMLLRFAYGQTLNRPEFRELAPFSFYDFNYNFVFSGNPNLGNAKIQNVDLRYEYYPSPAELISFAAFYKYFDTPIETYIIQGSTSGGTRGFEFLNAESSYSYGVELEVRKSLANVLSGKFFENMNVVFNASLLKSEVNTGAQGSSRGQSANRPLQGQAAYIVNTALFYDNEKLGLQVNLLYNVVGKYILFVGFDDYPDIYVMPRNIIDLTISKNFGEKFTLKAGVSDILNQTNVLLQDGNGDKKFDRDNDQIIQRYSPGQLFSLGFSYRIF